MGSDLSSVEKKDIKASLQSSATSGKPSKVLIDKITSRRQVKAMSKVLGDFIGMKRRKFHVLDVNPSTEKNMEISARGAAAMGFLNFSSGADYHLTINNDSTLDFNLKHFEENISNIILVNLGNFWVTYVLYFNVVKKILNANKNLSLPEDTKLIHIGGWKKLESKK